MLSRMLRCLVHRFFRPREEDARIKAAEVVLTREVDPFLQGVRRPRGPLGGLRSHGSHVEDAHNREASNSRRELISVRSIA